MKKMIKPLCLFAIDSAVLLFAFMLSYLFRFDFNVLHKINIDHALLALSISFLAYMSLFFLFKIHRVIWRYASLHEMVKLSLWVFSGFVVSDVVLLILFGLHYIPLSIIPLQAFFYLALLVSSRAVYRMYRMNSDSRIQSKKVLIIGAGQAADGILRDMLQHAERGYQPVAVLDDDPSLHHRVLRGVRVLGGTAILTQCIDQLCPELVVLAIPSLSDKKLLNSVYEICDQHKVPLRVLPGLAQLTEGRVTIDALQPVEIEDLLGRDPVTLLDKKLISRFDDKTVMVTGGGGSIGSELCRQIALNRPSKLIIVDNNEFNLYKIERELKLQYPALDLAALLIDIACYDELNLALNTKKPHILFHAAAYKHVPMLEYQALSAVKNNVLGTQNIADLSDQHGVEQVVLVSTDKAVNPTNIMGMTKRIGEIYCQNKNKCSQTRFSTVRFGNVLGSAGSVLPLFREQLQKGGPLTVTDAKMTRYFMMIPEAVSLILQAFLLGQGGEIFVLDMGQPVKIVDLAEKLITLSGKVPYKQIDIQFTGIRPGEKLFEELFYDAEHLKPTQSKQIFESHSREYDQGELTSAFGRIRDAHLQRDSSALLQAMLSLVPEYDGPHKTLQSLETV